MSFNGKEALASCQNEGTKVTGDLKVGQKVTIQYQLKATDIEVKGAPAKPAAKGAPKKK